MCGNNSNNCQCDFTNILELILRLQQEEEPCEENGGCSKPFLGPLSGGRCFNTRPITLTSCCTGKLWELPYTLNGAEFTSTVFRIESLDDNCATFRILARNPDRNTKNPFVATNDFFTIDLGCVSVLKCLKDTFVDAI